MRVYAHAIVLAAVLVAAACSGSKNSGKPCTQDAECELGQVCDGQVCSDGCRSPRDCPPDRPLCDSRCVQCIGDGDCPDAQTCISGTCRKTCLREEDCPGQHCDLTERVCVDCLESSDCELGNVCADSACVAGCDRDRDCPPDRPTCDPSAGDHGLCYECDGETCGPGRKCVDHVCRFSCSDDSQCSGQVCDTANGACVDCLDKAQCSLGEVCAARSCVAGCEEDRDCPGATPQCDPQAGAHGTCFQCTAPADCGPNGTCVNHMCQGDTTATMANIAAGSFVMGSDADADTDNPRHVVTLAAFSIDTTEVTYARYKMCVNAGRCALPDVTTDYSDATKQQRPVTYVAWQDADTFCTWAGKRLPTEAEWERAARSADERKYPWGAAAPTCTLTNASVAASDQPCVNASSDVATHPTGISPAGLYDMAGNVREWVADWYAVYPAGNATDPTGPATGTMKIARGGSFRSTSADLATFIRPQRMPTLSDDVIGFRCAKGGPAVLQPSFTVAPSTGSTMTVFAVDASSSTDPVYPTSQLQVRWDWTADGTFDTSFSTTKTATHSYATPGTYTIRAEVRNPAAVVRSTTRTVTVTGTGGQGSPCTATQQCLSGYVCIQGNICAEQCLFVGTGCTEPGTQCNVAFEVGGSVTFACQ